MVVVAVMVVTVVMMVAVTMVMIMMVMMVVIVVVVRGILAFFVFSFSSLLISQCLHTRMHTSHTHTNKSILMIMIKPSQRQN